MTSTYINSMQLVSEHKETAPNLYFNQLHSLITNCSVTSLSKYRLTLEQGAELAVEMVSRVKASGNKIILVGNGGSAAIASHQALDFWNAGGIKAMSFSDSAQLTCLSNDYGYENAFKKGIEIFAEPKDMLIAISSSGESPNILNAVNAAREKECGVITFSGFEADNNLRASGDLNFYIDSTSYGLVEVSHLALIHYLTDTVKENSRGVYEPA